MRTDMTRRRFLHSASASALAFPAVAIAGRAVHRGRRPTREHGCALAQGGSQDEERGEQQDNLPYTTYTGFDQLLKARDARYVPLTRVSDPGTREHPVYTGFFFYQVLQFDTTGRYLLGLRVYFQGRDVKADDRGDVGFIDLKEGFKWTKIGETTAWNWQQGSRLRFGHPVGGSCPCL